MDNSQMNEENQVKLRLQYRTLLNEAEQEESSTIETINEKLAVLDDLFQGVKSSRELAMDSGLLNKYASMGSRSAKSISTNVFAFNPVEFAGLAKVKLRSDNGDEDENEILSAGDWLEFGKKAGLMFKRCPSFTSLLGTFPKFEEKEKRKIQREKIDVGIKESVPETVTGMNKSDQDLTTEEVERVLKILKFNCQRFGPLDFFEFVTDPSSFSRTVENIFHLSFIIKDGFAVLYEDDSGKLTIAETLSEDDPKYSSKKKNVGNVVLSMTKKDWESVVEIYKIERAVIPTRDAKQ